MMGVQAASAQLFYDFCLDDHVPSDHLLRSIDGHLGFEGPDLTRTFGLTSLNVRPAPRRRCLARGAGRICAPQPRPRRSLVLGAGKFPSTASRA